MNDFQKPIILGFRLQAKSDLLYISLYFSDTL